MRKILICIIITAMVAFFPIVTASLEDVNTKIHIITISTGDESISVEEDLTIQGESNETYSFLKIWIPTDAQNVNILFNNNEPSSIDPLDDNIYNCDISNLTITKNTSIKVSISYILSKDTEKFTKKILRHTTSMSVKFDENEIYSGEKLSSNSSFSLILYKPSEIPLNWYITVFIILLIILLIASTLYLLRKQKSSKIEEIAGGSEELLNTRKTLLMSMLKDIEKQHRSKQISDDTYHKLKEQYKQQAVNTMKKLEDMKSKI